MSRLKINQNGSIGYTDLYVLLLVIAKIFVPDDFSEAASIPIKIIISIILILGLCFVIWFDKRQLGKLSVWKKVRDCIYIILLVLEIKVLIFNY
ncbi:hypothetical protein [Hornefia butyriciproducens]|uniref:Uncharacterized protein n=1 Tax=Hornefia butyriciproducens TaxID=2652293 RepID=A0A6L5Y7E9_9FIRM|nr:hypothetical protein [Hornefia butyriciproducens]MST52405.1 hypothetical protein [Hornefia butyriciproducens]